MISNSLYCIWMHCRHQQQQIDISRNYTFYWAPSTLTHNTIEFLLECTKLIIIIKNKKKITIQQIIRGCHSKVCIKYFLQKVTIFLYGMHHAICISQLATKSMYRLTIYLFRSFPNDFLRCIHTARPIVLHNVYVYVGQWFNG